MSQPKSDTWGNNSELQSPALVKLQMEVDECEMSPVAGLTANMSGASLGSTPRRKLSAIHNIENTPADETTCKYPGWSAGISPPKDRRLMKNVMKLPDAAFGNYSTGNLPVYNSKSRGLCRRISLQPLSLNHDDRNKPSGAGNKENGSPNKDRTSQHSQLSFGSPSKPSVSPSKFAVVRQASSGSLRPRQPLEDYDANSQDSGCCTAPVEKDVAEAFRFTEPLGTAPRRLLVEQSPRKDLFISPMKSARGALFHSFSSSSGSESIDDGFMELLECEKLDEDAQLPSGMNTLLSGALKEVNRRSPLKEKGNSPQTSPFKITLRPPEQKYFGRSLSYCGQQKVRNSLFSSPGSNSSSPCVSPTVEAIRAFKRPEPPCGIISPLEIKRHKSNTCMSIAENEAVTHTAVKGTLFSYGFERHSVKIQRSFSETEATIKRALQKASQEPDLIGDFTKPFILPLMDGRHQDLKSISPETLASLIRGQYKDSVASYTIVDCRYPYEYDGGHIQGARNLYTKDQIWKEFVDIQRPSNRSSNGDDQYVSSDEKRNILIFHCEFSSERGPNMTRFLRNCDRTRNKDIYPALNYPEIYLLDGGYKNFFENHSDLCEPRAYQPMRDPKFESDLRLFRSKSKSWSGDNKNRQTLRSNLKRLGL
ncbi:M-phase inducer phosphatase-like isoform X1 [Schistocerca piceifrons]|uniref:M-phase inducer phosphatase-like isoform X1 n=1 Tax=Schistocerca piceifrons TaxID=274613 RepID=UPI001F5E3BB0|nr:M-phase inducer phosphatase-like isoform X1 [Schistocerca piceifrons]